jgi:hypothetical protein
VSLTRFMRELVANPEQLARYKQDPATYLEATNLGQDDKETLSKLTVFSPAMEVSTVMSVRMPLHSLDFAIPPNIPPGSISLGGVSVSLTSPRTIFLAEKGVVECRLLKHSYLQTYQGVISFSLHICYVAPNDPNDIPFVLQINTIHADNTSTPLDFDLKGVEILLNATDYILLLASKSTTVELQQGSYYNPSDGTLFLDMM